MDTCRKCGAAFSPALDWCGLCFTPRPREADGVTAQDRQPLRDAMRDRSAGAPAQPTEFSRWRSSPTSFGPVGRAVLTITTLLGLVAGEPLSRGLILASVGFDVPQADFMAFYAAFAVPLCAYLIVVKIWKRVRVA